MNRLLVTRGKGVFEEIEYVCPPLGPTDIRVKSIMTGVCRSDIDMMQGNFGPLPDGMSGHEGLGQVVMRGSQVTSVRAGDFVATRGEPAYADYYNVRKEEYVSVPELHPRYIIEPVACGVNLLYQALRTFRNFPHAMPKGIDVLIIGSGFLAWVVAHQFQRLGIMTDRIHVIGSHNVDLWKGSNLNLDLFAEIPEGKKYDVIIDLSSGDAVFREQRLKDNGVLILAAEKHPSVNTTFGFLLWAANTIVCPSPRTPYFYGAMQLAVTQIETGSLNVDSFWSKGYNRDTEWQQAFVDGVNRPDNYSRGYIYWG